MSISTGSMGVGVMAILSGLIGAYGLRAVLLDEAPKARPQRKISVPLALANLPEGREIVLGDIAIHPMTHKQMVDQNFPVEIMMLSADQIIGRVLRSPLKQGQPFTSTGLYLQGGKPSIKEMLKPGYRAVHLTVPDTQGGSVTPKSFVDILFRTSPESGFAERTFTLMEAIEVLAVERPQVYRPRGLDLRYTNGRVPGAVASPIVTVAVTPEQAQELRVVMGHGELSLIPRADDESFVSTGDRTHRTLEDVLGIEAEKPLPYMATEQYYRGQRHMRVFDYNELMREYGNQNQQMGPATRDYPLAGGGPFGGGGQNVAQGGGYNGGLMKGSQPVSVDNGAPAQPLGPGGFALPVPEKPNQEEPAAGNSSLPRGGLDFGPADEKPRDKPVPSGGYSFGAP